MIGSLSKKTTDNLIFFSFVIFFGGAFICWNSFVKPMNVQIKSHQANMVKIAQTKTAVENLDALQRRFVDYKNVLSETQLISWLIDESNRLATDCGLTIISASPGPDIPNLDFRRITLRIEARGTYHQLGDFISSIENSERLIKISDFSAERGENATKGLRMIITLCIFTVRT